MSFLDLLKMACGNFLRRKARTLLTVAGVVIGTMAVVIMISIGQGLEQGYTEQIKSWGSLTQIEVYPNYSSNSDNQLYLDEETVKLLDEIEHVSAALPQTSTYAALVMGKKINDMSFVGIDISKLDYYDIKLDNGEPVTAEMFANNGYLIGYSSVFQFYNPKKGWTDENSPYDDEGNMKELPFDITNPEEARIKMAFDTSYYYGGGGSKPKGYDITCTGVMARNSSGNFGYSVVMDMHSLESLQKKYWKDNNIKQDDKNANKNKYSSLYVVVDDMENVTEVQKSINELGFQTWSSTEMLEDVKEQMGMIQAVLGGIGAVAFLVAAIGISNTMVMSTYERTREIGIMKVLGCKLSDIMTLFLTEAAIIGFAGGLVGLIFSLGISALMNALSNSGVLAMFSMGEGIPISVIPIWLIVGGIAFSTLVGVISGFYPALRATRLSALDAIKNE